MKNIRTYSKLKKLIQHYTERDQEVVDELGNLLDRTGKREQKISEISSQLEVELEDLSAFLENLASRRPKGELWHSSETVGHTKIHSAWFCGIDSIKKCHFLSFLDLSFSDISWLSAGFNLTTITWLYQ